MVPYTHTKRSWGRDFETGVIRGAADDNSEDMGSQTPILEFWGSCVWCVLLHGCCVAVLRVACVCVCVCGVCLCLCGL